MVKIVLTKKDRWLLIIIILSLLIIAWRFWGANFNFLPASGATGTIDELRQKVYLDCRLLAQSQNIKNKTSQLHQAVPAWETLFYQVSPEDAMVDLVSTIDSLTWNSGLSLREKQLHWNMPGPEDWSKIGVTISGRAGFQQLIGFLNELSRLERLVMVEKIQLQTEQHNNMLSYRLTLSALTKKVD